MTPANLRRAVGLTLLVSLLAGCSGGGEDLAGPASGARELAVGGVSGEELAEVQVLHVGNGAEPGSIDPHRAEGVPSSNIQRDLFEGLVNEAPNGDLIPGAAESWEISDDGLTYTFNLRRDARWSNGDSVLADDWVYSLRRSLDPMTMSRYTFILNPIRNAESIAAGQMPITELGVRAIDDYTLEIQLEGPTPYFLGLLTHSASYAVHQPSVEAYGDQHTRPGNLVSNGAFQLEDWVVQSHMKLVRNPQYWDNGNTILDEVWYYATEDQTAELRRYRADELDMTSTVPTRQLAWARENLPDDLTIAPYLGSYYFGFNVTRPPFKDNPSLRRALALAIDRDIITRQVTGAGQLPSFGWVPPVNNYEGQKMPEADWTQAEREAQARRLYAEAGYSAENPLRTEIIYNTQEDHRRLALAIAAMWKQVLGVEAGILNQEWKVFLDTRRQKIDTQIYRGGWIGDYNDAFTFAELMLTTSGLNDTGYSNAEYDALLQEASMEGDLARRAELLQQAEAILLEDLPILPIYYYVTSKLVKPWVGGYESNIMDHHRSKNFYILRH
ncbi:MAG: peptide ABC transporter substrate-binding protein [Gammaproteobacteria bacterium]|nr:peptide ABC transporter substrate-binding protein [Gammaproteobacteria bacterium]MDH3507312.1 peptide ABC transporter substrate-binding protein [Gammaproteobacteria bacterium]